MNSRRSQCLLDPLFTTEKMRAIFSDHGRLQAMLDARHYLGEAERLVARGLAARRSREA